jgi:uncharacterized membrane-anchored protein
MKIVTLKNYIQVLENMKKLFEHSDSEEKQIMCDYINEILEDQLSNGFFGTEGQRDPRGDQRD